MPRRPHAASPPAPPATRVAPGASAAALPRVVETPRLSLSPWRFEDLPDLLAYATDEAWGRFLPVPRPYGEADARAFLAKVQLYDRERHATWAIREAGRAIGGISLRLFAEARIGELGYSIAPARWRQGYATEAARALIDAAFTALPQLARVRALADVRNAGSRRVLRKCGLRREGILRRNRPGRDGLIDEAWYGLLREEWGAG